MTDSLQELRQLDRAHFWHPFTQMRQWCADSANPLILSRGEGATLYDVQGNAYFDGNSSIWTNIHGHNHPRINQALHSQLDRLAHCSALGFSNEPAIRLAARLAEVVPGRRLSRVFFTDDGSTAMECACKMALQYWQLTGHPSRTRIVAFDNAYHGDTMGAASLGGIRNFRAPWLNRGFEVARIAALDELADLDASRIAVVAIEPLIQGAAGMKLWPPGMLKGLREWCDQSGALLLLDEVMTGFGRTGTLFACEQEGVVPDVLALAKGLTGGYLPLAATLTTEEVFAAFLGEFEESKTFFYGHSYCANPLGCAAALASLDVFRDERVLEQLPTKIDALASGLRGLAEANERVGEIRQCGLIAGIELVCPDGGVPDWTEQTGARVCLAARRHGLLTRPILDTVVLMPPLCASEEQILQASAALGLAFQDCFGD